MDLASVSVLTANAMHGKGIAASYEHQFWLAGTVSHTDLVRSYTQQPAVS